MKNSPIRRGMTLILSGPSGAGKSSIYKTAFKRIQGFEFSVSCTTRQPRPGEVDGVDYFFLNREEFEKKIEAGAFAEFAQVHGNYYGTLKTELCGRMENGTDILLDIDVQGAAQLRKLCETDPIFKQACEFIFVVPPSFAELERRLRARGTDTETDIERRLSNAKLEMHQWQKYAYVIVNDKLEVAVDEFCAMATTFRRATSRYNREPFYV